MKQDVEANVDDSYVEAYQTPWTSVSFDWKSIGERIPCSIERCLRGYWFILHRMHVHRMTGIISTEILIQAVVVLGYILLDASKGLVVAWSYSVSVKNFSSVFIGVLLSVGFHGRSALKHCFDLRAVAVLFPMATCFTLSQLLGILTLEYFDPGSLKIQSIIIVAVCAIAFFELRNILTYSGARSMSFKGLTILLPSIVISSAGSVFAEKFIKKTRNVPFYIQKVQLSLGSVVTSILISLARFLVGVSQSEGRTDPRGLFGNWDWKTVVTLVDLTLVGWLAGLLVKKQSSVVKNLAQCVSSLLTYFGAMMFIPGSLNNLALTLVAMSVIQGVLLYFTSSS